MNRSPNRRGRIARRDAAFHRALSRRTFLQGLGLGAGGALLAPLLGRLEAQAQGAPNPPRVIFVVEGNGFYGFRHWSRLTQAAPEITPFGDALPAPVRVLSPWRDKALLLNGLANRQGLGLGAGHYAKYYALGCVPNQGGGPGGITIDTHLARRIGVDDVYDVIRLGAAEGTGLASSNSAAGPRAPLLSQFDPIAAFNELFGVVAADAGAAAQFTERGMLLDYMREDINRILPRLAGEERIKMQRYLASVETFQRRQSRVEERLPSLRACAPAAGPDVPEMVDVGHRAEQQFALATQALLCNLTRVVVLSVATAPYPFSSFTSWGFGGRHTMGHGQQGGVEGLIATHDRIAGLIGGLVSALEDTPEGDGTMFDNTVVVFINDNGSEHHSKYENFPVALFGDLGGRLNTGRLVDYPNLNQPGSRGLPQLWNSLCHAVGHPEDGFAPGSSAPNVGPLDEVLT